jgi:hypothetical protein
MKRRRFCDSPIARFGTSKRATSGAATTGCATAAGATRGRRAPGLDAPRDRYAACNVLHFHEKLIAAHGIQLSYRWVKTALQTAGLISKARRPGARAGRSGPGARCRGMVLHTDASTHS